MNQIMARSAVQARKFKRLCASTVMEKKLTDSCAEMPSSPSRLPAMCPVPGTVCSACGQRGPPALTPAQEKPQKENRHERGPSWPMQERKVEFSAQTPVLCKRYAAVTSIPVLCTTGRLDPGASVSRTLQFRPSTQLQLGTGRPLAPLACRQEKSSACGSMLAKWDPKSVLKAFDLKQCDPVCFLVGRTVS